jgi:LAS superfamily LD-carboxypeptidase LdcB
VSNYADGDFKTKYGTVTARNPGRVTAPPNLQTYDQDGGGTVTLQGPALRAFRAAEKRITPKRMLKRGKVKSIQITGVGYRSFALQKALFDDEPGRFANPNGSLHVEGLAVDVDQGQSARRLAAIKRALVAEGWFYGVDGEPWHASYRLSG